MQLWCNKNSTLVEYDGGELLKNCPDCGKKVMIQFKGDLAFIRRHKIENRDLFEIRETIMTDKQRELFNYDS